MNRRDSLKTMSLSLGYAVATPTLMQLLTACEADNTTRWKSQFLSQKEALVVDQLVDVILPTSETVGGLDVDIPQFIDLIIKDILPQKEQNNFRKGSEAFHNKFKDIYRKDVLNGTKTEFTTLLTTYFKITPEKQALVFEMMKQEVMETTESSTYYIYKYLICIRHYALVGYYSSKHVGTEILNYNPVPGGFEACVPVGDVGNVSSI